MDAIDLILLLLGLAVTAAVAVGCMLCLIVWIAGVRPERGTEVCPPTRKP